MAASAKSDCGSSCSDAASCSDANVVMASATADCAGSCASACDSECGGDVFNTRMVAILAAFNTVASSDCGSSCSEKASCGSADVVASCSESTTVMAAAKADGCPALAAYGVAHMAAATSAVFVPAAFFSNASIDMDNLTSAGCCRSGDMNASGESSCGDADKACCSKGEKTVASAN